jgi:hypothetical protein
VHSRSQWPHGPQHVAGPCPQIEVAANHEQRVAAPRRRADELGHQVGQAGDGPWADHGGGTRPNDTESGFSRAGDRPMRRCDVACHHAFPLSGNRQLPQWDHSRDIPGRVPNRSYELTYRHRVFTQYFQTRDVASRPTRFAGQVAHAGERRVAGRDERRDVPVRRHHRLPLACLPHRRAACRSQPGGARRAPAGPSNPEFRCWIRQFAVFRQNSGGGFFRLGVGLAAWLRWRAARLLLCGDPAKRQYPLASSGRVKSETL